MNKPHKSCVNPCFVEFLHFDCQSVGQKLNFISTMDSTRHRPLQCSDFVKQLDSPGLHQFYISCQELAELGGWGVPRQWTPGGSHSEEIHKKCLGRVQIHICARGTQPPPATLFLPARPPREPGSERHPLHIDSQRDERSKIYESITQYANCT